jgi:hypothetical protein
MLRKILLGVAASLALLPQPSKAAGGGGMGDVADSMRRTAAIYSNDPAQRCPNIAGSQYWFLGPNAPNYVQQYRR